ncbi:hypothetical protein AB0H73_21950 [Streptomyces olivoreticuli]
MDAEELHALPHDCEDAIDEVLVVVVPALEPTVMMFVMHIRCKQNISVRGFCDVLVRHLPTPVYEETLVHGSDAQARCLYVYARATAFREW